MKTINRLKDEMTPADQTKSGPDESESTPAGVINPNGQPANEHENSARSSPPAESAGHNTRTMFFQPPPWVWTASGTTTTTTTSTTEPPTTISAEILQDANVTQMATSGDANSSPESLSASSTTPTSQIGQQLDNAPDGDRQRLTPQPTFSGDDARNDPIGIHRSSLATTVVDNSSNSNNNNYNDQPNELDFKNKITSVDQKQQASAAIATLSSAANQAQPYKKGTIVASATSSPTKGFLTSRMMTSHAAPSSSVSSLRNQQNLDPKAIPRESNDATSLTASATMSHAIVFLLSSLATITYVVVNSDRITR